MGASACRGDLRRGHGLKFSDLKIGYHEGSLADVVARHRNPPVELPADAGAVKAEIGRWLEG